MNIEVKVNAIIKYIIAETEDEKQNAIALLKFENMAPKQVENSVDKEISEILLEIGFTENIKGYYYIVYGIKLAVENPRIIKGITKELYPSIAKEFSAEARRVERAMRTAINKAFDRSPSEIIAKYFGNTIAFDKGTPTNSEFIAKISNIVRRKNYK